MIDTMESSKPGVYKNLDAWRGVAALWVVMFHVTTPIADGHPGIRSSLLYRASEFGAFGVWMFFVISGYCIAHAACQSLTREQGLLYYCRARLRRIYPPCWASAVLYFVCAAAASILVAHGRLKSSNLANVNVLTQHPLYYIANLTLTQKLLHQDLLQGVYWTLCYEVAFYVLVGLGLALTFQWASPRKLLTALHVLTVSALLLLNISPSHSFYPLDLWPYFGVGILLYDLIRHPKDRTASLFFVVAGLEVAAFAWRHHHLNGYVDVGGGISLLFSFCFAVLLLSLYRFDAVLGRLSVTRGLAWVGLFSYSLYLNHYIVVSVISKVFEMKGKAGSLYDVCMIVSVLASVAFARLFYQYFERPFIGSKKMSRPEVSLVLSASDSSEPQASIQAAKAPLHLNYLDGMRGLAALYVVLYHLGMTLEYVQLPHWAERVLGLFRYGHFSVDVFIVLSGYCLMSPVVQSGSLRGGIKQFLVRRSRRILPPYYAALVFSLLLLFAGHWLPGPDRVNAEGTPLSVPGLVSHLLLIHNLNPHWEFQIDGPMWSVATEWQIYFVFAFLLLPLWRRFGAVVAIAAAFTLGMIPHWLLHGYADRACFWFVGLFALGMAGALINFSSGRIAAYARRLPWLLLAALGCVGVKAMLIRHGEWLGNPNEGWWRIDPVVGIATVCLIVACTSAIQRQANSWLVRIFSAPPALALGAFSYSLYLTHAQILTLAYAILKVTHVSPVKCFEVMLLGVLPLCLGLAYLFYLGFERPFLKSKSQKNMPSTNSREYKSSPIAFAPRSGDTSTIL